MRGAAAQPAGLQNAAYILLGLSLALSLTATPFFPGVAKFVAAVVVVAVHLAILLGVYKRIALLLHSFMGLLVSMEPVDEVHFPLFRPSST